MVALDNPLTSASQRKKNSVAMETINDKNTLDPGLGFDYKDGKARWSVPFGRLDYKYDIGTIKTHFSSHARDTTDASEAVLCTHEALFGAKAWLEEMEK